MNPSFTARFVEEPLAPVPEPALVLGDPASSSSPLPQAPSARPAPVAAMPARKVRLSMGSERTDTSRLEGFPGVTAPGRSAHSSTDRGVGVAQHARNADRTASGRPGAVDPLDPDLAPVA